MNEIQNFCYKYQPFGVILKGFSSVPDFFIQLLDIELAARLPNTEFLVYSDKCRNLVKLHSIGGTDAEVYQFANRFVDVLCLNTLKNRSMLYQARFMQDSINDINLLTLQDDSIARHKAIRYVQQYQYIDETRRLVSVENYFEKTLLSLLS